jgi:hypothetical protein
MIKYLNEIGAAGSKGVRGASDSQETAATQQTMAGSKQKKNTHEVLPLIHLVAATF